MNSELEREIARSYDAMEKLIDDEVERADRAHRAMGVLQNWRAVYALWQLGERDENDPELQAVRDHRESTLLLRAELSAITGLLLRKGLITHAELVDAQRQVAETMNLQIGQCFPGFVATEGGIRTLDARRTIDRWRTRRSDGARRPFWSRWRWSPIG